MKKSLVGIIFAVTFVASLFVFPVQSYASEDIDQKTTRETVNEDDEVGTNNGTVGTNNGKIGTINRDGLWIYRHFESSKRVCFFEKSG